MHRDNLSHGGGKTMGYRSDGIIVVAFESLEEMREVLAVYRLDPRVQKHNPFQKDIDDDGDYNWTFHTYELDSDTTCYLMRLDFYGWKWYADYEDVQSYQHIFTVCKQFARERENFTYAYRFVRGGEEHDDYDEECYGSETYLSQMLVERLTEEIFVRMTWELRDDLTENTTQLDYIDNQTVSQGLTKTTKENDHVSI
jgi:hypothetical protein